MVWLSRFIAAILVSLIAIAVLAQVFDATLLNSKYLDKTASKAGTYTQLAVSLQKQLLKNIASQGNNTSVTPAQAQAAVQKVLTPTLLQTKISSALASIQAYEKGNAPVPTISIADVITQLQANGLPINTDKNDVKTTITLNGFVKGKQQVQHFEQVKLYSSLIALVLIALLVFLSWEEHRWKILPDLAIIEGLLLGIISLVFIFGVTVADKYVKLNSDSTDLTNTANGFAKALTKELGEIIAVYAVILLVIGITTRVLIKVKATPSKPKPKLAKAK